MDETERAATAARRTLALAHGVLNAALDLRVELDRVVETAQRTLARGGRETELAPLVDALRDMIARFEREPAVPSRAPLYLAAG